MHFSGAVSTVDVETEGRYLVMVTYKTGRGNTYDISDGMIFIVLRTSL